MSVDLEAGAAPPETRVRRPMAYVPALDGLRAVAVVGVMLFHGGVSWVSGGYLGVDVFFVLSGYLITTLLLREQVGTGGIDLRSFWTRRLRRLLPALLALLAAVAVATPFFVADPERASVRGDALASLAYVANWRFILTDQSYFAGAPSPLRHLWSLSVEEQWYIVFPVVLVLALRRARRLVPLIIALAAATVASALWMAQLASGGGDPSRAYYGTDTRAHSLLAGALLAAVAAQWPLHRHRRLLGLVGLLGAVGVVASYLLVSEGDLWMYRGGFLGLALATAALVAAVALPRSPLPWTRALAVAPLVAIGRVSYGLYLWHWPVNVFLSPGRTGLDGGGIDDVALLALRTAVAVGFTLASYSLIEVRVRREGIDGLRLRFPGLRGSRPATALVCGALVVWLLVAGTVGTSQGGSSTTVAGLPAELADVERGVPDLPETTVATIPDRIREVVEAQGIAPVPEDRPVKVLLVGDSVAWTLGYGAALAPPEIDISSRAILGCGVVAGFALPNGRIGTSAQSCGDWPAYWQDGVIQSQPDVVVIQYGAWEVFDHKQGTDVVEAGTAEMETAIRDGFDRGIETVLEVKPHTRFLVVGAPCMNEQNDRLGGSTSPRNDPAAVAWVDRVFEDYADDLGDQAAYADLGELLCPGGEFLADLGEGEVRPDGSHYAEELTGPVWAWLTERIVPFARTPVEPEPADGRAGGEPAASGGVGPGGDGP
ncbi:MAG: acyltransferase family protein [Iamia sp.]